MLLPPVFFGEFPSFELTRIKLRELSIEDSLEYLELISDPKVQEFIGDEEIITNLEEAAREISFWRNLFLRRESIFWAIANEDSNKLIGTIGFNVCNFHNKSAEISYDLMSKYWGLGIMSQALKRVLKFAFECMGIKKIDAKVQPHNIKSKRLLEKFHFRYQGILKKYRRLRGKETDLHAYSLMSENFLKNEKTLQPNKQL